MKTFFQNFEVEKRKLSTKLDISHDCKDNFNLQHTLKNLFKYRKNLTNEEILYIDKNLNENEENIKIFYVAEFSAFQTCQLIVCMFLKCVMR